LHSIGTRDTLAQTDKAEAQGARRYFAPAAALVVVAVIAVPLLRLPAVANDFAIYWAAGKKVLGGGNPYAPEHQLVQRIWLRGTDPLVLRNPPWTLPLILPFALLDYAPAQKLWLLVGLAAVALSVHWLLQLYAGGHRRRIGWIAAATFLPVAVVLAIGQIGPLLLLGVAGFVRFEAKQKYGWAGAFLFLLSLKPHLGLLLWAALFLYVLGQQRWRIALGFMVTLAMASAIGVIVHPAVFREYVQLWGASSGFVNEVNPTVGGLLGQITHTHWAQFTAAIFSAIWLAIYYRRHSQDWSWKDQTPLLLLVSMLVTWYGWFFDQVVLVPCVLQAVFLGVTLSARAKFFYVAAYLAINAFVLALILNHRTTFWYLWTMPAWLLLYLGIVISSKWGKAVVPAA
jgi:Glycosyltransferase family 87